MSDSEQTAVEVEHLRKRLTQLERIVVSFLLKQRETSIIEMSHIEDALGMPRTKEKRVRE